MDMGHKIEVIVEFLQDPWTWYFVTVWVICYILYKIGGKYDER